MPARKNYLVAILLLVLGASGLPQYAACETMDDIAEQWVKLALSMGVLEDGYVDAYQGPKDRHVFPWIEVNARFGLIKRTRAS